MTIFRESDKRVFNRKVSDRNPLTWGHIEDEGEIETVYEYTNTVANIKQRLEVMGFSLGKVKGEFEAGREDKVERLKSWAGEESDSLWSDEIRLFEEVTFEDYQSAFRHILDKRLRPRPFDIPPDESPLIRFILDWDDDDFYYRFPCRDIRYFLRAFLEVCPDDAQVIQDITDLVHGEYYAPEDAVCKISVSELTNDYPVNEKIIILTEGSTDKLVLEKSLELLYPHLSEYYSFMDFGISNASGSAGTLVNTIKAFVGSGITNRVIAIFDNDTAAQVALRGLRRTSIPPNIKTLTYPNIEIAKRYPTLGPSGVSELDINGLACSIELYFGVDILTRDGHLVPIHWKGYDVSVNQYQGEIMRKQELQDAFFDKLSNCDKDHTLISTTDWEAINLILSDIFRAFQ